MKKMAIWALAALAMFAISCDKNNTTGEGDVTLTASALVGEWNISGNQFTDIWIFTSNELTIESAWDKTLGTYTVDKGTLSYTITKAWSRASEYIESENRFVFGDWVERELYEDEKITTYLNAKLIYEGSVLVFNYVLDDEQAAHHHDDNAYFLFRKGAAISSDTKPIQGTWCRYDLNMGETYIGARVIFDGNKFELIITPWSEKYTGTYTYRSGYVTCTVTAAYSGRNPEGEGFGEGDIDPSTLEGTWYPYENLEDAYYYSHGLIFPFVADGDVAYSILANLHFKYQKK